MFVWVWINGFWLRSWWVDDVQVRLMFDAELLEENEEGFIYGGHYVPDGKCQMWQARDLAT